MKSDYELLDNPIVSSVIFHPRESAVQQNRNKDHVIPAAPGIELGARFHIGNRSSNANVLFFHGNGEIVADYDELGPIYNRMGINFLAVDYRGYGRSNGTPTVSHMMADCHCVFDYVSRWLKENHQSGPLIIMGRSLGSASALELSASYSSQVHALVIESGFAYIAPLLRLLGVDPDALGFRESAGFSNADKIRQYSGPTLIIHASHDHIIPFTDAETLFNNSTASEKQLVKIDGANHNDILVRGFSEYMQAMRSLVGKLQNVTGDHP